MTLTPRRHRRHLPLVGTDVVDHAFHGEYVTTSKTTLDDGTYDDVREKTDGFNGELVQAARNTAAEACKSVVSHGLRNPLSVAEGRLELAREECECAGEHLSEVARAHERIEEVIDNLLTLAREGEGADQLTPVDLPALAEECWHNVETARADLRVEARGTVAADRPRLQQLFENLFRNAVEHGGEGVTVRVGDLADGFYVEDDGRGIPEAERERAFDAGYSTAASGTGFGLSIVERVADSHGWTVTATEGRDGGARVEVRGVESPADALGDHGTA